MIPWVRMSIQAYTYFLVIISVVKLALSRLLRVSPHHPYILSTWREAVTYAALYAVAAMITIYCHRLRNASGAESAPLESFWSEFANALDPSDGRRSVQKLRKPNRKVWRDSTLGNSGRA